MKPPARRLKARVENIAEEAYQCFLLSDNPRIQVRGYLREELKKAIFDTIMEGRKHANSYPPFSDQFVAAHRTLDYLEKVYDEVSSI